MASNKEFGINASYQKIDKDELVCSICSDTFKVSEMNARGYEYVCNECDSE